MNPACFRSQTIQLYYKLAKKLSYYSRNKTRNTDTNKNSIYNLQGFRMIKKFADCGQTKEARRIFNKIPNPDTNSWNAMISAYTKTGKIEHARQLFDEMPEPNAVTYTGMITCYAKMGMVDEARVLFDSIPKKDVVAWTNMVKWYAKNDRIGDARKLFDKMPFRNLQSWSTMIEGYANCGCMERARELYDQIPVKDEVIRTTMVMGYAKIGKIEQARQVFDEMPSKDLFSWNTMITACVRNRRLVDAQTLFDLMPQHDAVSWNSLIGGYQQFGDPVDALKLFVEMTRRGIKPQEITFTCILNACTRLVSLEQGKRVHALFKKVCFDYDAILGNALIAMYAACGSILDARIAFETMEYRNTVSWATIIVAHSQHGYGKLALDMFECSLQQKVQPDDVMFVGVLSACSNEGLLRQGRKYFRSMRDKYGIVPNMEHYACMVGLLGRCRHLQDVEKLISDMPFEPDTLVWSSLLNVCSVHVNVDLAEHAAKRLFELEPDNVSNYALLANTFYSAGRLNEYKRVRLSMKEIGLKENQEFSWIEVNRKIHAFIVGERSLQYI